MMTDSWERAEAVTRGVGLVMHAAPEATTGFAALDTSTEDLMPLAAGSGAQRDGCVAYQAGATLKHGGTRQEVAAAVVVRLEIGSGLSAVYGAAARNAFEQVTGAANA